MDVRKEDLDDADRDAARVIGLALKVLRTRAALTMETAGARIGVSAQAWGKYENGDAPTIFRPSVQRRLSEALGQAPEALTEEAARIAALQP